MSGIYIKRMEMPKGCSQCRFFAWSRGVGQHCAVASDITFHATIDGMDVGYERNGDCPLVPVPSHGRLIDADLLPWILANKPFKCATYEDWEKLCDAIATAPTIIEKEEI